MAACFICETPFHLLNTMNYILNTQEDFLDSIDLYVGTRISNLDQKIAILNSKKLFKSIYKITYAKENDFSTKVFRYIAPQKYVSDLLETGEDYQRKEYDAVFFASFTRFVRAFLISHPEARIYQYDDGTASYSGAKSLLPAGKDVQREKFIYKLLGFDYNKIAPLAIYVNNPSICQADLKWEIRPLPAFSKASAETNNLLTELFGVIPEQYFHKEVVFLSQPYNGVGEAISEHAQDFRRILQKHQFIYRPHPGNKKYLFPQEECEMSGAQWEMICANAISDEHILIGACSTAQVSPKWFFNKEPYIIFTYRIIKDECTTEWIGICDGIYRKTKQLYKNPEKVVCVDSIEELDKTVELFISKGH